jgi:hypothetical protein
MCSPTCDRGGFGCRCRGRQFELVAGSMFVGHPGDEYTCTHEHHAGGDECLSFHIEPALADEIGAAPTAWRVGALPPVPALVVLGELAQAAARGRTDVGVDEAGLRLVRRFVELVAGREAPAPAASAADRRRAITRGAVDRVEFSGSDRPRRCGGAGRPEQLSLPARVLSRVRAHAAPVPDPPATGPRGAACWPTTRCR